MSVCRFLSYLLIILGIGLVALGVLEPSYVKMFAGAILSSFACTFLKEVEDKNRWASNLFTVLSNRH